MYQFLPLSAGARPRDLQPPAVLIQVMSPAHLRDSLQGPVPLTSRSVEQVLVASVSHRRAGLMTCMRTAGGFGSRGQASAVMNRPGAGWETHDERGRTITLAVSSLLYDTY
ncbi:unnamed protein product [Danaus chrysippus]|uniref:(African queen) hypothetical protein n=1 Tax=Danaus chrysippus TaxID=151541 RepID=A0A8J2R0H5_9NEOP|nr:unnamed protein product [Danaus chrysippus]